VCWVFGRTVRKPGPRAVGYDPRGGHGHVSFRANLIEPAVANDITTKNASAVEPARACRPDHERDKLSGTQGSLTDAEVAWLPAHHRLFVELQERHAMTQPDTFRMRVVLGNRVFDYAAGQ
jgi:hypothetical protein